VHSTQKQKRYYSGRNTYYSGAEKTMKNHEIPFFFAKRIFEYHVTDITIKVDALNVRVAASMQPKISPTFLLLVADIPKYRRLLRLLDCVNFMTYDFHFKSHRASTPTFPLSVSEQTQLLLPFERVLGSAVVQNVVFSGAFDPTLVARVRQAMMQEFAWLRAAAWEIYEFALSLNSMGDWAWRLKDADMTMAKYVDQAEFFSAAIKTNSMPANFDEEFKNGSATLAITRDVDVALLMVSGWALDQDDDNLAGYKHLPTYLTARIAAADKQAQKGSRVVSDDVFARFYHCFGVAELGLNHPIKASKAFIIAYKKHPSKTTREGHEAAKGWAAMNTTSKKTRLSAITACLPTTPLACTEWNAYVTPEVASEQWALREFGYQGPFMYADRIKGCIAVVLTNKPHPNHHGPGPRTATIGEVKPDVLPKYVQHVRQQLILLQSHGRLMGWVGL
jgi:hypothetical protein